MELDVTTNHLAVSRFSGDKSEEWDSFISRSYNGSFINTRRFLNYHPPERFRDHSLLFYDKNVLAAVLPACELVEEEKKTLYSHRGATFGGLIVKPEYFTVAWLASLIKLLDSYLAGSGFVKIVLKQTPSVFLRGSAASLDYLLSRSGYDKYEELSFLVPLAKFGGREPMDFFRLNAKQQTVQGLKQGLVVKEIKSDAELQRFHELLTGNLSKHDAKPVHTVAELADLKQRFPAEIAFYGCWHERLMIGGAMTWLYNNKVLHLQNIAIDYEYGNLRPANVLNYFLIKEALARGLLFSFGISTEEHGARLNVGLARFKEGFGAEGYLNGTYYKSFN